MNIGIKQYGSFEISGQFYHGNAEDSDDGCSGEDDPSRVAVRL